jgi:hypothetical protein
MKLRPPQHPRLPEPAAVQVNQVGPPRAAMTLEHADEPVAEEVVIDNGLNLVVVVKESRPSAGQAAQGAPEMVRPRESTVG